MLALFTVILTVILYYKKVDVFSLRIFLSCVRSREERQCSEKSKGSQVFFCVIDKGENFVAKAAKTRAPIYKAPTQSPNNFTWVKQFNYIGGDF